MNSNVLLSSMLSSTRLRGASAQQGGEGEDMCDRWSPIVKLARLQQSSGAKAATGRCRSHQENMIVMHNAKAPRKVTFSQELRALAQQFAGRQVQLGDILAATQGRGFNLLLVFIALPFITPIPLPGFSIPFGLAAAVIGGRLALGKAPWLPKKLLQRELPQRFLTSSLQVASGLMKALELFLRPRLTFMNDYLIFRRLAGVLIMLSGLLLVLPLPVPFSNSLPALTVLLLAAGALERDGVFFLAGCSIFLVSIGYFVFLALGGAHLLEELWRSLFRS